MPSPVKKPAPRAALNTLADFPPPFHLAHHPIYLLPYEACDGIYAGKTDCKYLSVGRAQYDPSKSKLSVKTLRYTESERWSRMSEELPAHRACDLVLLLALTYAASRQNRGEITVPAGTFQGQDEELTLTSLAEYPQVFDDHDVESQIIVDRLYKLKEVLNSVLP
jgi:hypothetical protein